jgi:hypothetical protein
LRQGLALQPSLAWNSLCSPGWSQTHCLSLLNTGISGIFHHVWLVFVYVLESHHHAQTGVELKANLSI